MNDLQFADDIMARIRARGGQYHERAYLFVLGTIEFLQTSLEARRHVTGAELAWACRDFARKQFGLLAPVVLAHWGINPHRGHRPHRLHPGGGRAAGDPAG